MHSTKTIFAIATGLFVSASSHLVTISANVAEIYSSFRDSTEYLLRAVPGIASSVRSTGNIVEVGSFEGRSANAFCDLFLEEGTQAGAGYKMYAFDAWEDHVETVSGVYYRGDVYARFRHNTRRHGERIEAIRGLSQDTVPSYSARLAGTVAFAYIDGSHTSPDTYTDAVNVWPMMRPGGYMLFDDYQWHNWTADPVHTPHAGIEAFVSEYASKGELQLVGSEYQLLVQKRVK